MKKFFFTVLLSLVSTIAAEAFELTESSSKLVEQAFQDLKPGVFGLQRSFYVYHYAQLSEDPERRFSVDDPVVKDHFKNWVAYFWDRSQDNKIKGYVHGFYAALDPIKTRSYGWEGQGFFMNRIEFAPGLKVLDIGNAKPALKETLLLFQSLGCSVDSYHTLLTHKGGKVCRDFQLALLAKLDIDAIQYNYAYDPVENCASKDEQIEKAFIILKSESFRPEQVRTFVGLASEKESNSDEERQIIESMLAKKPDSANVRAYKAKHLLNCENLR